jgi:hypothetical protein
MSNVDIFVRVLFSIACAIGAIGLLRFADWEMRWYSENVEPEPPPLIVSAYRRWRSRRR